MLKQETMLIRFVVSNFLSFDEEREFNMIAGNFKTHKHHVYDAGKVNVLKASAVYGANGAGKSNLVKALEFFQEIIEEGRVEKSVNPKKFRLNKTNEGKPSTFEIELSVNKKLYSYGVSINRTIVVEEWLYESGVTAEDKMIFERKINSNDKTEIVFANKYQKSSKQKLLIELMEESLLKSNELLLAKEKELKIDDVESVKKVLVDGIVIIHPHSKFLPLVPELTDSDTFKIFANKLLESFDTGVKELDVETIDFERFFEDEESKFKEEILENLDNGEDIIYKGMLLTKENSKYIVKKVIAQHEDKEGNKISFDLLDESDGTQRLLDFLPAFYNMLERDITFVIDEIDQSMHPSLLKSMINKVMAEENTKGQLIFTTHESNLLDMSIFRQDEIWFVEKDKKSGCSQLYSLSDFKPRYDLDIQKGYLKGRFGAIPFLANLKDLSWIGHGC